MREFIPHVITPEEAKVLASFIGNADNPEIPPIVDKIKAAIEEVINPTWGLPSYTRIEKHHKSHDWHVDTGSSNHMKWCDYGCSVLLSNAEGSGFLEYRDGTKFLPEEHFCGLAIHGSDVEHRTEQPGNRAVFLAFVVDADKVGQ
mgnify:FL=1